MSKSFGPTSPQRHPNTSSQGTSSTNLAEQLKLRLVATSEIHGTNKPPAFKVARKRPVRVNDGTSPKLEPLVSSHLYTVAIHSMLIKM